MQEKLSEVVQRYENMLEDNSKVYFDTNEFEEIGEYYLDSGQLEKAIESCDYGLSLFPLCLDITILKCHGLLTIGKLSECRSVLNRSFVEYPDNAELYLLFASLSSRLKEHDKAIEFYRKALSKLDDPSIIDVKFDLVFEYQSAGKYTDAIEVLKEILSEYPHHEAALFELSFCFDFTNKIDEGEAYFKFFTDNLPYSHIAWFNLGTFLLKNSKLDEALHVFELSCAIDDEYVPAWVNVGMIHLLNENTEKALQVFRIVLEIESDNDFVMCAVAECFEQIDNYPEAIKFFEKAFEINPFNINALQGLAYIYAEQEKNVIAVKYLERGKKIDNFHEDINLELMKLHVLLDNDDAVEKIALEMLEFNPKLIDFRIELAKVYFVLGNKKAYDVIHEGLEIEGYENNLELNFRKIIFLYLDAKKQEALMEMNYMLTQIDSEEIELEILEVFPVLFEDESFAGLFI